MQSETSPRDIAWSRDSDPHAAWNYRVETTLRCKAEKKFPTEIVSNFVRLVHPSTLICAEARKSCDFSESGVEYRFAPDPESEPTHTRFEAARTSAPASGADLPGGEVAAYRITGTYNPGHAADTMQVCAKVDAPACSY